MMSLIKLFDKFKNKLTKEERLIIYCTLSIFLPCYICVIFLLVVILYLLFTKRLKKCFSNIKMSICLIAFSIMSLLTSLIHQNYIGVICTIAIFVIITFIIFYMNYITIDLFEFIIDLIIFMSIFAAIYGLIEYIAILNRMNIDSFEIVIFDKRENRINSVFFNANYYAMMIEFFVTLCFYKILKINNKYKNNKKIIYYTLVIILNIFLLYLTGCRSAWPALAIGIFVLLLIDKHYKFIGIFLGLLFLCCLGILLFPNIFPRIDNVVSYFFTRENIWITALKALKDNWIIGQGPLTYFHVVREYGGHVTHHAHNVYIDPFLSHGVIGVGLLIPFAVSSFKGYLTIRKEKNVRSFFALGLSMITIVLIHGMTDYTIYFVQTAFVFLLVLSSYVMFNRNMG